MLDKYELTKTVVVGNDMLQSEYYTQSELELTVNQKRLLLYLISKINSDDTELRTEEISIADYCELFGISWSGGENRKHFRQSILALARKCFLLPIAPGQEQLFRWVGPVKIDYNIGKLYIRLDDSLKDYYIGLKNNYTIFQLGYAINFSSKYSYTIYEFLKSRANLQRVKISVSDAKQQFAYGKYDNFANFRKKVLDIAVREINAKSDINVRYKATKKGVAYNEIQFFIAKKTGAALERVSDWKNQKIPTETEKMDDFFDFDEQMRFDDFDEISVDFEELG